MFPNEAIVISTDSGSSKRGSPSSKRSRKSKAKRSKSIIAKRLPWLNPNKTPTRGKPRNLPPLGFEPVVGLKASSRLHKSAMRGGKG